MPQLESADNLSKNDIENFSKNMEDTEEYQPIDFIAEIPNKTTGFNTRTRFMNSEAAFKIATEKFGGRNLPDILREDLNKKHIELVLDLSRWDKLWERHREISRKSFENKFRKDNGYNGNRNKD